MELSQEHIFWIVSKDLSEPVRSHKDLDKDAGPYFKKAVKFYDSLVKQLVSQGHVLDLFASALDQFAEDDGETKHLEALEGAQTLLHLFQIDLLDYDSISAVVEDFYKFHQ